MNTWVLTERTPSLNREFPTTLLTRIHRLGDSYAFIDIEEHQASNGVPDLFGACERFGVKVGGVDGIYSRYDGKNVVFYTCLPKKYLPGHSEILWLQTPKFYDW